MGLVQLLLESWLFSLKELPLHSLTVVPMPVGYKTEPFIHGDNTRNYMRETVFVIAVHRGMRTRKELR